MAQGSRLTVEERARIAELAATGLPGRLIGRELGRSHRAVWAYVVKLRQAPPRERRRSPFRLSLVEREEISHLRRDQPGRSAVAEPTPCPHPHTRPRSCRTLGGSSSKPTVPTSHPPLRGRSAREGVARVRSPTRLVGRAARALPRISRRASLVTTARVGDSRVRATRVGLASRRAAELGGKISCPRGNPTCHARTKRRRRSRAGCGQECHVPGSPPYSAGQAPGLRGLPRQRMF